MLRSTSSNAHLRADDAGGKVVVTGYAAVFDSETRIHDWLGGYREVIRPGAFKRALAEKQDVRALVDHIPAMILGRTAAGTLRLAEDSTGLRFELDPPDTGPGRDMVESLRRGDISQCSFAFTVADGGQRVTLADDPKDDLRELLDLNLYDVSLVTYPAYPDTSVSVSDRSSRPWRPAQRGQSVAVSRLKTYLLQLKESPRNGP